MTKAIVTTKEQGIGRRNGLHRATYSELRCETTCLVCGQVFEDIDLVSKGYEYMGACPGAPLLEEEPMPLLETT